MHPSLRGSRPSPAEWHPKPGRRAVSPATTLQHYERHFAPTWLGCRPAWLKLPRHSLDDGSASGNHAPCLQAVLHPYPSHCKLCREKTRAEMSLWRGEEVIGLCKQQDHMPG